MGLITDLLRVARPKATKGRPRPAQSLADVERALERLRRERDAANAIIVGSVARRRELLLVDGSDAAIEALDRENERAGLTLERLEVLEDELLARADELRDEHKQATWRTMSAKYDMAASELALSLRETMRRLSALQSIHDAARAGGFANAMAGRFANPPLFLDQPLIDQFEAEIERLREASTVRSRVGPPAVRPAPAPAPKRDHGTPRLAPAAPPRPRDLRNDTPAAGEVLITLLRAGVEVASTQSMIGDRLALPHDEARRLVESGAADFAEGIEAAAAHVEAEGA